MEYLSIPHYRGLKEKYNEQSHGDGIFFTTDTHEIIANSASYGDKISSWTIENGLLTLTLLSGETVEIDFPEATEISKGMMSKEDKKNLDNIMSNGVEKLANPRTIWGQVFDGTSNVSGDITLDGNIVTPGDAQLVDLGLPSGTLWMDRNVGASCPEDAGLYFAWGETTGYTADEVGKTKQFGWNDYKFGTSSSLTKYNSTDGLTTLETSDDAVLQNVHKYSMPTKEQLQELIDGTTSTWTTQNGVNGRLFTSKTNDNSIFVPAAGYGYNGSMLNVGSGGYLWSSSLYEDGTYDAWLLLFNSGNVGLSHLSRCFGVSVRGVATPAEGSSKIITLPSSSGTLALDNVVTTTSNGLMSSSDKSKLDGIESTYLPLAGGTLTGNLTLSTGNKIIINGKTSDDVLLGDGSTTSLNSIQKQITTNKESIDEINNKLTWVILG